MTRFEINEFLNGLDKDFVFLHCDSWHFNAKFRCINCGVQEPNMLNIAAGMMLNCKNVIVYSIAGFVLEKCLEQMRLVLPDTGSITILNAGCHGEYPQSLGEGHRFDVSWIRKFLSTCGFEIVDLIKTPCSLNEIFTLTNKKIILLGYE